MKNLLLGVALASLTLACSSEQKASVDDASAPPAISECGSDCAKACCLEGEAKGECSGEKSEKKVCPVTGQEID